MALNKSLLAVLLAAIVLVTAGRPVPADHAKLTWPGMPKDMTGDLPFPGIPKTDKDGDSHESWPGGGASQDKSGRGSESWPGGGSSQLPGGGNESWPGGGAGQVPGGGQEGWPGGGAGQVPGGGHEGWPGGGAGQWPGGGAEGYPGGNASQYPGGGGEHWPGGKGGQFPGAGDWRKWMPGGKNKVVNTLLTGDQKLGENGARNSWFDRLTKGLADVVPTLKVAK